MSALPSPWTRKPPSEPGLYYWRNKRLLMGKPWALVEVMRDDDEPHELLASLVWEREYPTIQGEWDPLPEFVKCFGGSWGGRVMDPEEAMHGRIAQLTLEDMQRTGPP